MPGPPPKSPEHRRRRNATLATTLLPAEGRQGEPPEWPIGKGTVAEHKLWRELWATPQAVAWEDLGFIRMVARYCRYLVDAEKHNASGRLMSEVRQMEDRLGLTPMAMLRLRWQVAGDEVADVREERVRSDRPRLKAVDPELASGSG